MAIQWGPYETAPSGGGTSGMRVGIDVSSSAVSNTSSTVTFTFKVYTQNYLAYTGDSQGLSFGGGMGSGSVSFSNSSATGAVVLRATRTYTYTYPSGSYGVSPGGGSFSATSFGAFDGTTASKTVTVSFPARPFAAPTPPTGVTATRNSDTQITVAWTRTNTSARPYTSLTVQMRAYAGSTWGAWVTVATTSSTANSFVKTGLSANHLYQFQVAATNSVGNSAFVATSNVIMTPAAPSGVLSSINAGGATITTSWVNNAYTWTPAVTFTVQRSVNGGAFSNVATGIAAPTTSWTDPSPGAGSNQYQVQAVGPTTSLPSAFAAGNTVTTIVPPLAPTNLAPNGLATDLTQAVVLSWQHNPGGDGAPQSAFTIETSIDGGTNWIVRANNVASSVSSWTMPANTLVNGNSYLWRVRTIGITSGGYGPNSGNATLVGSTVPVVAITAPTSSTVALPMAVTWTYTQAQASPQNQWTAWLYAADGVTLLETKSGANTATSTTFSYPAEDATSYIVRVQASSAAGLTSTVASRTTTVSLPVPASVLIDPTYQPCTGTVVLHVEGADPAPVMASYLNLSTNPAMRATGSSVEVRRNRITNPSFRATDSTSTEVRRNYVTDPNCTAITSYNNPMGTGSTVTLDTTTFFSGTSSLKITAGSTAPDATYGWGTFLTPIAVSIGIGVQFQWRVRLRSAVNLTVNVAPTANSGLLSGVGVMPISLLANTWTEVVVDFTTTVALTNVYMIIGTPTASAVFNVDTVFVGNAGYENFDGSTPASGPYTYSWVGTANASQSVQSATLPEMRRNTYQNPSWRNTSGTVEVRRNYITDPRLVTASGWANVTASGAAGGATFTALAQTYSPNQTAVPGEVWTGSIDLTNAGTVTWTGNITVKGTTGGAFGVNTGVSVPFSVPVGATQRVLATLTIGAGADGVRMMLDTMNTVTGMRLDKALLERHSTLGTYFDGTTVNTGGLVYTWTGTANASASIASGPAPVTAPFLGYGGQLGVVGWVSAPGVYSVMAKMSIGAGGILAFGNSDVVQGGTNQRWASRFKARLATGVGPISFDARLLAYNAAGATLAVNVALNNTTAVVPADGSWADIEVPTATISPTQTVSIRPIIYYQGSSIPAGTVIEFKEALLARQMDGVVGRAPMAYIDGSTPAGDGVTYAWGGTANASTSYATVSRLAGWSVGSAPGAVYYAASNGVGVIRRAAISFSNAGTGVAGQFWGGRITAWVPSGTTTARLAIHDGSIYVADLGFVTLTTTPTEFAIPSSAALTNTAPRLYVYPTNGTEEVRVSNAIMDKVPVLGQAPLSFFDGATPNTADVTTAWASTANASESIMTAVAVPGTITNGVAYRVGVDSKTWATVDTGTFLYATGAAAANKYYAASLLVAGPVGAAYTVTSTDNVVGAVTASVSGVIPDGGSVRVVLASTALTAAGTTGVSVGLASGVLTPLFRMTEVLLVEVAGPGVVPGVDYFDGTDTNTSTFLYSWTGTADASTSQATSRAEAAVSSVIIERRVEGEDAWTTLVSGLAVPNDFVDTIPVTHGLNEYRVTAVSSAPSYRAMDPVTVIGTDGSGTYGVDPLWIFLAYGDGFANVLRVHSDPTLSDTVGRTRDVQPFLGRKKPGLLVGANTHQEIAAQGTLRWDEMCPVYDPDDCRYDSPPNEWLVAGREAEIVCYRDYTGRRVFGMLSDVLISDHLSHRHRGVAAVSFKVTETNFVEVYGDAIGSLIGGDSEDIVTSADSRFIIDNGDGTYTEVD